MIIILMIMIMIMKLLLHIIRKINKIIIEVIQFKTMCMPL